MPIFTSDSHRNALSVGYILNKQGNPYRIEKILGSGGFGITYLAYDEILNCLVALKEYLPNDFVVRDSTNLNVYPKSSSDTENFNWGLRCFIQEAQTLAQFNHPNIVRIRTFFEELNTAYIVMDYEEGDSLDILIQDGQTADEGEIEKILKPLLNGLALIHQAKFLHRDIKPANIYIRSKDHSPVLLDFGSARYDVSSRSRSMTTIVTPGYAPFEQYETKGTMQGAWTDIYAMGAVLYRLISAKAPTEAPERAGAIMRGKPDPLIPVVKMGKGHYSKHLLEAIDWALKINETERPQSIAAWRDKLFSNGSVSKPKTANYSAFITFLLLILIGTSGGYYIIQEMQQSTAGQKAAIEAEKARLEAERRRQEEEAEEARQQVEANRIAAEQAKREAEEAKRQAQEERRKLAAITAEQEKQRLAAEAKRQAELKMLQQEKQRIEWEKVQQNEIKQFVRNLIRQAEYNNVSTLLNFYGDRVDYFDRGVVNKNAIRKDKSNYLSRWPDREYQIKDEISISDTYDDDEKRITFSLIFKAVNSDGTKKSVGIAKSDLVVSTSNGMKIIKERQKILERHLYKRYYIIIKSESDVDDAVSIARSLTNDIVDVGVFKSKNDWYAIALEIFAKNKRDVEELLDELKSADAIPSDSFISLGKSFVRKVYP